MTSALCSGSTVTKELDQHLRGRTGPIHDHVSASRFHHDLSKSSREPQESEIHWGRWQAGATPGDFDTSSNDVISASHNANDRPPALQSSYPSSWTDEYSVFRQNSMEVTHGTESHSIPIARWRVSQRIDCHPSYPRPITIQTPPQIEAQFDDEMQRWVSDFGSHRTNNPTQERQTISPSEIDADDDRVGGVQPPPQQPQDSPDHQQSTDLSHAASELLDVVAHEHGPKWANSKFLALMRDLSNREKDVSGKDIITITANT